MNSTARPYDQQAFSPPDPTAIWHSHLALAIYIFVLVNFDALAQASDFSNRKETSCLPLLKAGFEPRGSQTPIRQHTECLLTNRLSYRGSSKNLNSTARPDDQQAFSPPDPTAIWHLHLALAIYIFDLVNFDALAQASDFRIERRQVVFLCWRQDSNPEGLRHLFASRLNACWQTDWTIEDQAKTWTRQPVPMISKHSDHLTPLPFGIRSWLWRYTYLSLLISMLWHRQAIFESKGDKLSSSAEGRIRTKRVSDTYSAAHWMPADKATELSRIKQNLNSTARPDDQQAFSPPDPTAIWHSHLALAIYIFVLVNFDALAQASDFRIERRHVVFLCWRQDSNPEGLRHLFASTLNACWQTDWAIEDQAKTWTRQPVPMISKHSAHLTPLPFGIRSWLWRYTYLLLLISMLCHRQAIFESKGAGDIHICCC